MNNEYTQLSVDELAADPAVQAYVLEGKEAAIWELWLEANPRQAVNMLKVQRILRQLDEELAQVEPVSKSDVDEVWNRISKSTRSSTPKAKVIGLRGWVQRKQWGRVAAMAVAAVGALYFLFTLQLGGELYQTEAGEHRIVALPDGSKVHLAPASTLRVKYLDDSRELNLLGEAFFEVEKGTPFTVHTSVGDVAVLGTSFSVEARNQLAVACATGKVKVTRKDDETLLTPGLSVRSNRAGLNEVLATEIDQIAAWRNGRLVLNGLSLAEAVKRFEHFYARGFKANSVLLKKKVNIEVPTDNFPLAIERINFVLQTQVDTSQTIIKRN